MHQQKAHQRHADDDRDYVDDTPDDVDEHELPCVSQQSNFSFVMAGLEPA
jgi:hypothetical protein